jgi:hypothetical protein
VPTILADYLGGIVRAILMAGLTYLVKAGYVSESQTVEFATWAAGAIVLAGWSVWSKTENRRRQLVAQAMGQGITEAQVIREVEHKKKTKTLPSVLIAPDAPPTAQQG